MARFILFVLCLLVPLVAASQAADSASPAERRIAEARRQIAGKPDSAAGHTALGIALARRARETSDPDFYRQADAAIGAALALEPANLEARKARIWVRLGKHEFAAALAEAQALNAQIPDDVLVYGYLTDAYVELGRYEEAEKAAQWMLDLRPGNVPGFTRAAYLRELFGDVDGAIELMQLAYNRTPQTEIEDRAWIATQLGHLEFSRGRKSDAENLLKHALELYPDYHYALAQLAKLRAGEKRRADAVALYRKHVALSPHPENFYALGVALLKAGNPREGQRVLAEFETKARAEMNGWDNANRELTLYYVEQAKQPAKALQVARLEAARRQDVFTLDALAWALSASGQQREARTAIDAALAVGIKDAGMLYRAGMISLRQGDRSAAQDYFGRSLEANPHSEYADLARQYRAQATSLPNRARRAAATASR